MDNFVQGYGLGGGSFLPFINNIADTETVDLVISGGGILTANLRQAETRMVATVDIASGATFSLAGGPGYTVVGSVASLGVDAPTFNNTPTIQVYLSGLLLRKATDVVRASATTFVLNFPMSNGDDLQVFGQ